MTFSRIVGDRLLLAVAGTPLLFGFVCGSVHVPLAQPLVSFLSFLQPTQPHAAARRQQDTAALVTLVAGAWGQIPLSFL